ncbi:porin family protein [uncultured Psychroserpens sp.]|uniref:porin family protein n=1 Tax=uncultured Psychroserpens sp. TaxID=255436 RepID=UPI0026156082|nr:porin family protein [uncultured Psychroserpens sp.]
MKKLIIIAFIVLCCSLNLNAQADKGDFEIGTGLGLNISNVVVGSDSNNGTRSKTGFNLGVSGEYYFSDRWGIKAKLIYDSKGWGDGFFDNELTNESYITDFNVTYLTVPVMANWHFGSTRKWYLNFGPYIGFLLNAEEDRGGTDVKDAFNSTDFGIALGVGYKFNVGENTKLFVEYDAQSGLSDVFSNNLGSSVRNGRSSFNIGIILNNL